ncbi:MAG: lipoate protein ligase C-terminal domain-containing protein [archaeon]
MRIKNDYKVAGGKLVRVEGESAGERIQSIRITGDFFMFPEDGIEKIENGLSDCALEKGMIAKKTADVIAKNKIQVQGFTPEDLAEAIVGGVQNETASP